MPRNPRQPPTDFAPAGRANRETLQKQLCACLESPVARIVLESLEGLVMVLNPQRQILAANEALLCGLDDPKTSSPVGFRPGEVLGCVHASEGTDGCGTSRACSRCGAVLTVLAAQANESGFATGECLLSTRRHGEWNACEYQVQARTLRLAQQDCVVLILHDISAKKRKEALESLFFHDVINLLHGLHGWGELLQESSENPHIAAGKIIKLSERITHEVEQQRLILQAEQGQLLLAPRCFHISPFMEELDSSCRKHPASSGRNFETEIPPSDQVLETDSDVLLRVVMNMSINALEAVPSGGCVKVGFRIEQDQPTFFVWNEGIIPEGIALSIFQRSFSTKSKQGRGLGTYAMKLLGENFLGGQVGFQSGPDEGTTFYIRLPKSARSQSQ